MKFLGCLCVLSATIGACFSAQAAGSADAVSTSIYYNARSNNRMALERLKRNGYSIDATDSKGNSALCTAMMRNDRDAYSVLRQMGANPEHPCVKRLEASARQPKSSGISWDVGPSTYVGAALLIGGGIAIAAGGGGGGGSSSGSGETANPGGGSAPDIGDEPGGGEEPGGDEPGGEEPIPGENPSPKFFETSEYNGGNFLGSINASDAYSRFYTYSGMGDSLTTSLQDVKVGIVDTGVYANNVDLKDQGITGFNYDYGPCSKSGNTQNCWQWSANYKGNPNVVYMVRDGVTYISKIGKNGTKAEYDEWANDYEDNYSWSIEKDLPTSFYPNKDADSQHGTHVAGIIGASKNGGKMHGVAFDNAKIIAARWDFISPLEDPARKLIDEGAQVINFSLGVDSTSILNASTINTYQDLIASYLDMFRYQAETKTVFVFSAGNENQPQPGILNGVPLLDEFKDSLKNLFVTVVALNSNNAIATYSNRCGVTMNYCIAAPGNDIYSTITGDEAFGYKDGTSMAAPVVTGSIAFLMGAYPYMTPQEVVKLVFETADDIGEEGVDNVYGHGLINLGAATTPQGELTMLTSNSVNGNAISAASTTLVVPATFKSAMTAKMPKSITVFDKYKRPYRMPMQGFVTETHNGDRNFKNDLYAFSRYQPKKKIKSNSSLSFSYAPAVLKTTTTGLGTMEVEYKQNENITGFYYTENTSYNTERYFDKTLSNPFLAMNSAYGLFNRYNPSTDLGITMGFTTGENGLYDGSRDENDRDFDNQAYAFDSSVSFAATDNVTITAMSGVLYEDDAMLGLNGTGAFGISDSSTYYAGLSIGWSPVEKLFLSGAYYQGWTDAGDMASNLMQTSRLVSDSFALDAHYLYSKSDVVGFQISSPLRIYQGKARFDMPVGRDNYSDEVYREQFSASLKPDAREYKFALYHSKELNERMNFKTEVDMRLNPDHQRDAETDYRVMFGFNWTFN